MPAGIGLALVVLGFLWLGRSGTEVVAIESPSAEPPAASEAPVEPTRVPEQVLVVPDEPARAGAERTAPTERPAPRERPAFVRDTGGASAPAVVPVADRRAPPAEATPTPRALTRDSSGDRAPVAVPAREAKVVERPQLAGRAADPVRTPEGDLAAAIATIKRCPTMQQCIQAAAAPLERFGHGAPLPDPGVATVARFDETRSAYRRALSEVRAAAKGLVERPGGEKHEGSLRALFEALPQSSAFELEEHEIPAVRRAIERAVERWLVDRRATISSSLAMQVRLLTPAGGRPFEIEFQHPPSAMSGLSDLKSFLREELASAKEIKSFTRQRFATVKVVLNPGGRFGVD